MTKTKREIKYYYELYYEGKSFRTVCSDLKERYPNAYFDCGPLVACDALGCTFYPITFYCTPKQYKNIVTYARRRVKIAFVSRLTKKEYI